MSEPGAERAGVEDVINRYAQSIDANDLSGIASCLTEDAVLSMAAAGRVSVRQGRAAIIATFRASFAARTSSSPPRRHFITNTVLVECSESSARARSYVAVLRVTDGQVVVSTTGRYTDRLVRVGDAWLIAERVGEFDNAELLSSVFLKAPTAEV